MLHSMLVAVHAPQDDAPIQRATFLRRIVGDRIRLAVADDLHSVVADPFRYKVVSDGCGTLLRQLLVMFGIVRRVRVAFDCAADPVQVFEVLGRLIKPALVLGCQIGSI